MSGSSPPKEIPKPEHASSILLSKEANTKILSLLEPRTQSLASALVSVVLSKPPKYPEWKPFRVGVATLIKDYGKKTYSIQIFDIVDWERLREEELIKGTAYQISLPTFHQFETTRGQTMGLKFSSESEARSFAQIARAITMNGHYKTEGCPMSIASVEEVKDVQNDTQTNEIQGQESKSSKTSDEGDKTSSLVSPPEPPPQIRRDQTLSRPQRPASVCAPILPPPPPPPSKNSNNGSQHHFSSQSLNNGIPQWSDTSAMNSNPQSSTSSSAALDRKRQKSKRITKDMIGKPTDFQHVYHVGANNLLDEKSLQSVVETVRRSAPSRPPPPPPPTSNRRNSAPAPQPQKQVSVRFSLDNELEEPRIDNQPEETESEQQFNKFSLSESEVDKSMLSNKFGSVYLEKSPSGELAEELLGYLQDAYTNLNSNPSDDKFDDHESNESIMKSSATDSADTTIVEISSENPLTVKETIIPDITITESDNDSQALFTYNIEHHDISDSTIVPDSESSNENTLTEISTSPLNISSINSEDVNNILQDDLSNVETLVSNGHSENNLSDIQSPVDMSNDGKTNANNPNSNLFETESTSTSEITCEIHLSQAPLQNPVQNSNTDDHYLDTQNEEASNDISTNKSFTDDEGHLNSSEISEKFSYQLTNMDSKILDKPSLTDTAKEQNSEIEAVTHDPPQKPARRKSANKSKAPPVPPSETESSKT